MSDALIKAPKGTRDLAGKEVEAFSRLEAVARRWFQLFQFAELRTPIFESVDLFKRSLGETSDVVEKEMFTFSDRGERDFSLRPEGTAGVVRYFLEQKLYVKGALHRLFYAGPMFRAERPQAGRYRQFWQIGAEFFGDPEATADADTVLLLAGILKDFGIGDFVVQFNSLGCKECRPKYREALIKYLESKAGILNEESKRRMKLNPLRVLDSKEDGPKLTDAPQMKDFLCGACKTKYEQFQTFVQERHPRISRSSSPNVFVGDPSIGFPIETFGNDAHTGMTFVENPKLVRGLDYYTGVVFEIVSPALGAQNAVAAGGRYDILVESLGGPPTPAVGFALGMDRVVEAHLQMAGKDLKLSDIKSCVVIPMAAEASFPAFRLAQELRSSGFSVPPIQSFKKKLKNQLSSAVDIGATYAILIGEDELKSGQLAVKNLQTRKQTQIPQEKIFNFLK